MVGCGVDSSGLKQGLVLKLHIPENAGNSQEGLCFMKLVL